MINGILRITDGSSFPLGNAVSQHAINFAVNRPENPEAVASGGGGEVAGTSAGQSVRSELAEDLKSLSQMYFAHVAQSVKSQQQLETRITTLELKLAEKERQLQTLAQRIKTDVSVPSQELISFLERILNEHPSWEILGAAIADSEKLSKAVEKLIRLASGGEALPASAPEFVGPVRVGQGTLKQIQEALKFATDLAIQGSIADAREVVERVFQLFAHLASEQTPAYEKPNGLQGPSGETEEG